MLAHLAVLAAEGAEKSGEVTNPVLPDNVGELFWGAIAFFSLWILMRYVCLPPLLRVRAQREQQIQADREAAAAAETAAEQVRRDYDATLAEARTEASRIIETARNAAEEQRAAKVATVDTEVAAEKQAAMAELDHARAAALGQLQGAVTDLAVTAASKVVQAPLDAESHRDTVEGYVRRSGGQR
jgi:F-type H+-transporting ATPase subunit b